MRGNVLERRTRAQYAGALGAVALILAASCGGPSEAGSERGWNHVLADGAGAPAERVEWRHDRSALLARAGSPRHSAIDPIANPGEPARVEGKFAYGKVSKDLEDEKITLWIRSEGRWARVASALTDDDGRAAIVVSAAVLGDEPGPRAYEMVVGGDGSRARGLIWVLEAGTRTVLFDIDGTLTTGKLVRATVLGDEIEARPGAPALVAAWREAGLQPLYLTGRPYLYDDVTRSWLARHGFPPGPVAHTDSVSDSLPSHASVGEFKANWLRETLAAAELEVIAAYGNVETDVCAYARAGLAPERTFIWGGERLACEGHPPARAVEDYRAHLKALEERAFDPTP